MRISDWSSDVCSSDLAVARRRGHRAVGGALLRLRVRRQSRARRDDDRRGRGCRLPRLLFPAEREVRAVGRPRLYPAGALRRSEEHTSELQSLMRISYAVFCLKKKTTSVKNNKPILQ